MKAPWLWITMGLALGQAGCKDPLKSDVEVFCKAVIGSPWKTFNEVGPYVAERIKTDEFRAMFQEVVNGKLTIWQVSDRVRGWMKQTGVKKCKTLDVIVPRRPDADQPVTN